MQTLKYEEVGDFIRLSTEFDPEKTTLFSIVRDEMYFLPAFFDHYRSLGFQQFLIFDDQSTDGTTQYLLRQPDCVVVTSDLRYGTKISVVDPSGMRKESRAGVYFKAAIPRHLSPGRYVTYVDADEFLLLPPGMTSISGILDWMAETDAKGLIATMVEFFPRDFRALGTKSAPRSFQHLLALSPYFEAEPLLRVDGHSIEPEFLNVSKTTKLFRRYGIDKFSVARNQRLWPALRRLARKLRRAAPKSYSARHKTVVIKHEPGVYLSGTHDLNVPAAPDRFLCLAHFVFTPNLKQKVRKAVDWKSHKSGAIKYRLLDLLLKAMEAENASFLDERSERHTDSRQLLRAGDMFWPLD